DHQLHRQPSLHKRATSLRTLRPGHNGHHHSARPDDDRRNARLETGQPARPASPGRFVYYHRSHPLREPVSDHTRRIKDHHDPSTSLPAHGQPSFGRRSQRVQQNPHDNRNGREWIHRHHRPICKRPTRQQASASTLAYQQRNVDSRKPDWHNQPNHYLNASHEQRDLHCHDNRNKRNNKPHHHGNCCSDQQVARAD